MTTHKALSMNEQIALQREVTELTALLALADERAKLHQRANEELAAHVERMREALTLIEKVGATAGAYRATARTALIGTPAQSLQAIKRRALADAADICDEQGREWDSDGVVTEKNYAAHCAELIRKYKGQ